MDRHHFSIFETKPQIAWHLTPLRHVPFILADGLQPKIGERSLRLGEHLPAIFLFPTLVDLENALSNWMGDEIEEADEPFALMRVHVPKGLRTIRMVDFEIQILDPIPPSCLMLVVDDILECSLDAIADSNFQHFT